MSELKTSDKWHKEICPSIEILDPDGWDRTNFTYSFYEEEITEAEFRKRLVMSTIEGYVI